MGWQTDSSDDQLSTPSFQREALTHWVRTDVWICFLGGGPDLREPEWPGLHHHGLHAQQAPVQLTAWRGRRPRSAPYKGEATLIEPGAPFWTARRVRS